MTEQSARQEAFKKGDPVWIPSIIDHGQVIDVREGEVQVWYDDTVCWWPAGDVEHDDC